MGDQFRDFHRPGESCSGGPGGQRGGWNGLRFQVSGLGQLNELPKASFDSSMKGDCAHLLGVG